MTDFTPESDRYTPGNPVSCLKNAEWQLDQHRALISTLLHTLVPFGQSTKNCHFGVTKSWLDDIKTPPFLISVKRKWVYLVWEEWRVCSKNHTYTSGSLNKALLHAGSLCPFPRCGTCVCVRRCVKCSTATIYACIFSHIYANEGQQVRFEVSLQLQELKRLSKHRESES